MGPDRIKPMPPGYQATIWPMSEEAKERVRKHFEDVYTGKVKAGTLRAGDPWVGSGSTAWGLLP